jgi:hypothetical protein
MYEILILIPVLVACAYTSYKIGRRDGAESLMVVLHKQKIICYDDKGNVKPNPFFDA